MAYPMAAFLTGWLSERGWDRRYSTSLAAMLAGLLAIYAGGVWWLAVAFTGSIGSAIQTGVAPFALLDLLKIAAAAMILPQAWRRLGTRGPEA
jgi:biotin transporter BioY